MTLGGLFDLIVFRSFTKEVKLTELRTLPAPPHLNTVYTISCGMDARDFFTLLKKAKVSLLMDTRLNRTYSKSRFAHEKDLRFLCEEFAGISYEVCLELAPTSNLRDNLEHAFTKAKGANRDKMAWTKFLKEYVHLICSERKVLAEGKRVRELLYGNHEAVAILCACQHHEDCHRQAAAGVFNKFIQGIEVKHLSPTWIGKKAPDRKSPRRHLLEPIQLAGLEPCGDKRW